MRVVRYWVRSVDCRERLLTRGGWSVWEVLADETGREFGGKCVAEAQTKREAKDVAARLNARLRGRRNAGRGSFRKTKKQLRKIGVGIKSSKRRKHTIKRSFEGTGRSAESLLAWGPGPRWRRGSRSRANLTRYRVALKGGRWKYFKTLAEASAYANRIFQRTGVFAAVEQANPARVKGRKVKGGRAVTLRNFTGTIVKRSDGTVNILGRGRKR